MRMLGYLVVNIIQTIFDGFHDKQAFPSLLQQNVFEFGTFCQLIECLLDSKVGRGLIYHRSMRGDAL